MQKRPIEYSAFLDQVEQKRISKVIIQGREITAFTTANERLYTYSPEDPKLIDVLYANGVAIEAKKEEQPGLLAQIFIQWFPLLLIIGVWIYLMRQMQGGGGRGALSFGRAAPGC